MTATMDISVPGVPVPFIRHETRTFRVGRGFRTEGYEPAYNPNPNPASKFYDQQLRWNRLHLWRASIRRFVLAHKPAEPWDCPFSAHLVFYVPRPESLLKPSSPRGCIPCDKKPDADNYAKVILDTITDCGIWVDDGRVWDLRAVKLYHAMGCAPGARIRIRARVPASFGAPFLWEQPV